MRELKQIEIIYNTPFHFVAPLQVRELKQFFERKLEKLHLVAPLQVRELKLQNDGKGKCQKCHTFTGA